MKKPPALVLAAISILLWSSLASLAQGLGRVPPFQLVGWSLAFGCLPALGGIRNWFNRPGILALGTLGIFGYHFLLFLSFRHAPPIEANLLNYLWPILIVLFSSRLLPGHPLRPHHLLGGLLAFVGAALVILGGQRMDFARHALPGYLLALSAAVTWALYSVLTKRLPPFPTATVGGFCASSAALSLLCHTLLEPACQLNPREWQRLLVLGLGPLGVAFYTWDAALKKGDPRTIAALSYLTPLLSTSLLAWTSHRGTLDPHTWLALLLIVSGAAISSLANCNRIGRDLS